MSTWNDDDRAFFDKALLLMAPLVYQREKTGATDFLMQHASMAAESLTNARKSRLSEHSEPPEFTHENASTVGA